MGGVSTPSERSVRRSGTSGDRVVFYLIRVTGNWDLAEECAQDAFTKALEQWPRDGVPDDRGAWPRVTARTRAYDRLRRSRVGEAKLQEIGTMNSTLENEHAGDSGIEDDRLRLISQRESSRSRARQVAGRPAPPSSCRERALWLSSSPRPESSKPRARRQLRTEPLVARTIARQFDPGAACS